MPASVMPSPCFRISDTMSRARGAERHAHADLRRPLRGQRGDDAVEADRREQQRQRAEGGQQAGDHPLHEDGDLEVLGDRAHVEQRHVRDRARGTTSCSRGTTATGSPAVFTISTASPRYHCCAGRYMNGRGLSVMLLYLPSRATPTICSVRRPSADRAADRIAAGEVAPGERLVDDGDVGRARRCRAR